MTLAPITGWRIHIGAHKTATTHLQETLAAMRPALLERGVDYIPLRICAGAASPRRSGAGRPGTGCRRCAGRCCGGWWRATSTRCAPGPATLVLSEEKLIGGSQHIFAEPIYPGMQRIIALLATLGRQAELTLFLSIRSFDTQLPSAYVQELRYMPPIAGGFDNIKRRVLARPPSWFELVRRIRAAAPGVPLRIWRQEDYRDNTAAILAALRGVDGSGRCPRSPTRTGPSRRASRRSAPSRRCRRCPSSSGASGCGRSSAPTPAGPAVPAVLRRRARAAAGAAYAADLERIAALDPKMLLRF